MAMPVMQPSFASGELSPALWSRVDLAKFHIGLAKARNFFVDYRGGISNRCGTAFVGRCKAPASGPPPRNIPFAFSTLQTYALEFGAGDTITYAVTGTSAGAGGCVRLALVSDGGLCSGAFMTVTGVGGTTEADGTWQIVNVGDGVSVDLIGTTYVHAWTSGGSTSTLQGYMRVIINQSAANGGAGYVLEQKNNLTGATNNITGVTRANPGVVSINDTGFNGLQLNNGDWLYFSGLGGMTQLNNKTFIVQNKSSLSFTLTDLDGNVIDTTNYGAWTSGGIVQRIYTMRTPYLAADLRVLKFTQSADVMTLTHPTYPVQQITRTQHWAWTITQPTFGPKTAAPTSPSAVPSASGTTHYNYVTTSISENGITESGPSAVATALSVTMSTTAGASVEVAWLPDPGAQSSNVYRQQEVPGGSASAGQLFGYIGSSTGATFVDSNITPDFTRTPPMGFNPFAAGGNPGSVAYYQGRQVFAGLAGAPDEFDMTRSGDYLNFDYSTPSRANDGVQATIASQKVNAIKHLLPMNSLIALAASGAWKIDAGTNGGAVTPSNLEAAPQAFNGANDVPPIPINYDILYVQAKGAAVRDLAYNFYVNVYTGQDMTVLSRHLFFGHQLVEAAYAEEPFKIIWYLREDGVLLAFTYLKEQDIYAWTHHDTDGLFQSVCTITEGQEDAIYVVVLRLINGNYVYYQERMASRNMGAIPEYDIPADLSKAWFVDAGVQHPQTFPSAVLTPLGTGAAPPGLKSVINRSIVGVNNVAAGAGLTAPTVTVIDQGGTGSGAVITASISGGSISGYTIVSAGQNYSGPVELRVNDPTGSGVVATAQLSNDVTMNASASVFTSGNVGDCLRVNNGVGTVRAVNSGTQIVVNVSQSLRNLWPAAPGAWSCTTPVQTVTGLDHLNGKAVAILADGDVLPPQVVVNGAVTLQQPASAIVAGLPFTAQAESLYLDIPGEQPTVQGKRKKIQALTLRVVDTRGLKVSAIGINPNTQQKQPLCLVPFKERDYQAMGDPILPITGDMRVVLDPIYTVNGQVVIQQDDPLPATVTGYMPEVALGDV